MLQLNNFWFTKSKRLSEIRNLILIFLFYYHKNTITIEEFFQRNRDLSFQIITTINKFMNSLILYLFKINFDKNGTILIFLCK
jgi:hypothetical protein